MTFLLADRVQVTATANTTVSFTLSGAMTSYQSFAAIGNGNTTYYGATDGTNWETGIGTYSTTGPTLTRTTILSSSNSGSAVTFSGTVTVWVDYPAGKAVITNDVGDVLVNQSYDQGTGVLQVTGQSTFNGAVVDKSLNLQGGNNLVIQSQALDNASWNNKLNIVATGNATTAPDGTTTATQIADNSTSGQHIDQQISIATATTNINYVVSSYFKNNTRRYVKFGIVSVINSSTYSCVIADLSLGTITQTNISNGTLVNYSIISSGNGWYRIALTTSFTYVSDLRVSIDLCDTGTPTLGAYGGYSYIGNGSSIYAWGAQLELGTVASAYTPTTTAAITTTNNINVPSGQVLAQDGTGALPTYSFGVSTGTGFFRYSTTGGAIGVSGTGTAQIAFNFNQASEVVLASTGRLSFSSTSSLSAAPDLTLYRDAANILAQRNSTNAQTFRLYNTYTDASNYERLSVDWSTTANTATISTQNAGTGSARNLAIGQDLYVNTVRVGLGGGSISSNVALGSLALNATATGSDNTGVGRNALNKLTSGTSNTSVGSACLQNLSSGINNCGIGLGALNSTNSSNNTAVGYGILYNNISGANLVGVGSSVLLVNTTVSNLTAIGTQALTSNTTNVATLGTITGGSSYTNGTYTGVVMTLSSGSTAITYPTATIVVSGGAVTSVTLTSNGVGFKDTTTVLTAPAASIGGTGSGFSVPVATLASGTGNVAVGYQAGFSNTTGNFSTMVGYQAGYNFLTGNGGDYFGYQSGYGTSVTTPSYNAGFGRESLFSVGSGSFNVGIGRGALYSLVGGNYNTAIGYRAGYGTGSNALTSGSASTYIGYQTVGSANNNSNEMVIGYQAVGLGSNTTVIGNSSTTLTKAFGVIVGTNYTVATLPSASTSGVGARAFVTDALAPVFGSVVAGSGAVPVPVYSTGSAWNVG